MNTPFDLDPTEEVVITVDNIIAVHSGLAELCRTIDDMIQKNEVSDERSKELMIGIVETMFSAIRMFPRKSRDAILKEFEKAINKEIKRHS